jgi:archaellum component FlaD/FlaE/archaellum component FlaC
MKLMAIETTIDAQREPYGQRMNHFSQRENGCLATRLICELFVKRYMDLGDVMQELGLDAVGASSASSTSSQAGEAAPGDPQEVGDLADFDEIETADQPNETQDPEEQTTTPPSDDTNPDVAPSKDDSGTGNGATGMDDEQTDEILDRLDDISYEIDQLSTEVEENQSTIRTLRNEREGLRERMDSIEENNAKMLGIYDRLTNEINPFAADWDERYDQKVSEQEGPEYGVIEPPENEMEVRREIMEQQKTDDADANEEPATPTQTPDAEGAVSFDDLKHKHTDTDEEKRKQPTESTDESEPRRDQTEVEHTTPKKDVQPETPPSTGDDAQFDGSGVEEPPIDPTAAGPPVDAAPNASDGPYLSVLAPTVATEVLIMEWLTMLIDIAGPAGAMKALDFYERVGWISADIKRQLEAVLSGALERGDPPSRPPSDLTADEHNRSFAHIVRLAQQEQLARSRGG